jgi:hypothetical protein
MRMQPNVIVAEAIGHRARFAWLGVALAATLSLFLVTADLGRGAERGRSSHHRAFGAEVLGGSRVRQCGQHRRLSRHDAERVEAARAEHRAYMEAARAERRAHREAERAVRRALREQRLADRAPAMMLDTE